MTSPPNRSWVSVASRILCLGCAFLSISGCGKGAAGETESTVERQPIQTSSTRNDPTRRFQRAALVGDVSLIGELLSNGVDVNAAGRSGSTALHLAAMRGQTDVAVMLIKAGGDVGAKHRGQTPLHLASSIGALDVARLLLDAGADVNARHPNGWTPLHRAATMGHLRVVELLLDRGAYVNSLALFRETAVRSAATRGHRKVAELLVDRGALIDRITGFELPYTVEEWALIDADPDADSMENTGWSPLHRAAWAGNKEAVAELLRRGADRKMKDEGGALPLHWAARMGHLKIAELLLNNKTVMEALLQPRGMDSLIQRSRPEVNAPDNRGWTPLHEAVGGGRLEVVAFLIDRGGLIDDPTTVGSTPLHIAAGAGYRNLVQLLIERGAEVNPTATLGRTPLHGARARGHTEIIEYLEEHGGE